MTADRQRLYEHIVDEQRQSLTGQLCSEDTFDLYQTFMALADRSGVLRGHVRPVPDVHGTG